MEVATYISALTEECPDITEVWLFGSRVNGTARSDSDWDLFVFGTERTLCTLQAHPEHQRDDIDLLVVLGGDEFKEPWGVNPKRGWLSEWEWKRLSPTQACYTAPSRMQGISDWDRPLQAHKATRVWTRNEP